MQTSFSASSTVLLIGWKYGIVLGTPSEEDLAQMQVPRSNRERPRSSSLVIPSTVLLAAHGENPSESTSPEGHPSVQEASGG